MRKPPFRALLFLGTLVLVFLSLRAWLAAPAPAFASLPIPNGYDLFVQAARSLPSSPQTNHLAEYLEQHQESLALFARALSNKTEVPIAILPPGNLANAPFADFKFLAQSLVQKGRLEESNGDLSAATKTIVDLIRFGQAIEHGPLISFLVGVAIERMGLAELRRIHPKLSPTYQTLLAADIAILNHRRISWREIIEREQYFARTHASNPLVLIYARFSKGLRAGLANAEAKHQEIAAAFRAFPNEGKRE
jgi:hypothetical protein